MAILWKRHIHGKCYEVRSAGRTRRLYTNGVFHSQFNPRQPVTGSVWDLLSLPAFFPGHAPKRVLVLGVGGGAVIRQLQHFLAPQLIVGIELDRVHLDLARRFFGLEQPHIKLYEADAEHWVRRYRGPRFDLIIDDVFGDEDGEPLRAIPAKTHWFNALLARLNPAGALVMNFPSRQELHESAYFTNRALRRRFASAFQLSAPLYENAVGAFMRRHTDTQALRRALQDIPGLDPRAKGTRLRYRIKTL